MPNRTPSEINRRLAEYELIPRVSDFPDYLNDVAAALRVCERIADERDATFETSYRDKQFTVEIWGAKEVNPRVGCSEWPLLGKGEAPTLPAAICLALVAVLDGVEAGGE